jgi:outer membrane lipase/esterase
MEVQSQYTYFMIGFCRSVRHTTAALLSPMLLILGCTAANAQSLPAIPGLNDNQTSMAQAIITLCPNLRAQYRASQGDVPSDQLALFDACAGVIRADSGPDSRSIALQELTGEELNAAQTSTIDFGGMQRANIVARLVTLRQARGSTALAALSPQDRSIVSITTGGAAGDDAVAALDGRLGLFLNGRVGSGSKDTTDLEAGYDVDATGLTAGADYRINEQAVLGAAVSYGKTDADYDNNSMGLSGGTFDSDGYSLALFGSWYGERSYVDLIASYGKLDHESRRRISYTLSIPDDPDLGANVTETWDATARGSTDSDMFSLGMSYGYNFGNGAWRFGPLLSISYLEVSVDGFSEKGAPGLELTYGDQDGDSLQLQGGFDVGYTAGMSWGVLAPYARFVYVREQQNDSQVIDVRYSSDPLGTVFAVRSDKPDRDFFRWGVGLSALFANGFSTFIDYDAVLSFDTVDYGEVTVGLRYAFR